MILGKLAPRIDGVEKKKKNRKKEHKKICEECGEEYFVAKSEVDKRKFCSRTCGSRNYNRTRKIDRGTKKCLYCGKEFELNIKNQHNTFCSKKCSAHHTSHMRAQRAILKESEEYECM